MSAGDVSPFDEEAEVAGFADLKGLPPSKHSSSIIKAISWAQYGRSLALQTFHDFFGIFRFHPHLFQGCAKVLQEQVEVFVVQTMISGPCVGIMNILAGIHSPAEEHGKEHNLPGPEMRRVYLFKEMAQIIILQNFAVEEFGSSLDGPTSPDQFIEVLNHGAAVLTRFSYCGAVYRHLCE